MLLRLVFFFEWGSIANELVYVWIFHTKRASCVVYIYKQPSMPTSWQGIHKIIPQTVLKLNLNFNRNVVSQDKNWRKVWLLQSLFETKYNDISCQTSLNCYITEVIAECVTHCASSHTSNQFPRSRRNSAHE